MPSCRPRQSGQCLKKHPYFSPIFSLTFPFSSRRPSCIKWSDCFDFHGTLDGRGACFTRDVNPSFSCCHPREVHEMWQAVLAQRMCCRIIPGRKRIARKELSAEFLPARIIPWVGAQCSCLQELKLAGERNKSRWKPVSFSLTQVWCRMVCPDSQQRCWTLHSSLWREINIFKMQLLILRHQFHCAPALNSCQKPTDLF